MRDFTLEYLLDLEDSWLDREGIDGVDVLESNGWFEEGIDLYKKFIKIDQKEPRYAIMLADLYLQWGNDEKIRAGNYHNAYRILRNATIYAPKKPEAFYRLSFILANEERKWEAVLFYGKEALENGIRGAQRVKLLCNMALAYQRLGYPLQSFEFFTEAKKIDKQQEQEWFISLYEDKMKIKRTEPILLSSSTEKRGVIAKKDYEGLKELAMEGSCLVLDLSKDVKHFYAISDSIKLEKVEANILGFLIEHAEEPCPKKKIEEAVWLDERVGDTAVKRYISSLRRKLGYAMAVNDVKEVLVTVDGGYKWQAPIKSYVCR